ncbi:sigma 54-interacting transcriptional regulator [Candidatus Enterococcus ferrettii]|uniref:DNA translocase FtsK n=1 Tax=Candidatus Enterococcus ferrettii TaxID=2815324 RepID=A0ABV0EN94_9ENTE|nr:sigma 54-interacting transcriptional regulator [Enterococcus sp. 665A]MBO1341610.1 sigma 54-interacting transcriptional regulator [Enterococcus sp. 665A]
MNHRERILNFLRIHPEGYSTMELAERLAIPRPTVSKLLNELVRQNKVQKSKSYPVLYERCAKEINHCFKEIIGYDKSLKAQIVSCKSSVSYPPKGLPVLLLGDSGVGKSFLAEHVYHYAVETRLIAEGSPFKTLNCADYANNPELLSAALFGYVKGSFTGADADKKGIFEEAEGGYLFLDEVHQLPPAGQEKLFRYLDKGIISKLGSQKEVPLNVRLIFATTNLPDTMLETFIRRIPVVIHLPRYVERPVDERYRIIYQLFFKEKRKIDRDIIVSADLYNMLLMFDDKGNIGTIKNLIKVVLANAIFQQKNSDLRVGLNNLPSHQYVYDLNYTFVKNEIAICSESELESSTVQVQDPFLSEELLNEIEEQLSASPYDYHETMSVLAASISKIEKLNDQHLNTQVFHEPIRKIFEYLERNYGFRFSQQHVIFFSKLLFYGLKDELEAPEKIEKYQRILKRLKNHDYKVYKVTKIIIEMIRINLDIRDLSTSFFLIANFYMLYHTNQAGPTLPYLIIVSHGVSTANSISGLVNQAFGQYLFEGIDMPYNSTKKEVLRKLKKRLENIDTSKGVLILVDMGSLLELIDDIQEEVVGEVAMINNITSQIALETANLVLQKMTLEQVVGQLREAIQTTIKYIPSKKHSSLVLLACLTGTRSAEKIKGILKTCLVNDQLTYRCCTYDFLANEAERKDLIQKYNRVLTVTTTPVNVVGSIALQELLTEKGEQTLRIFYKDYLSEHELQQVFDRMIEAFTLENLMEQLTILNPTKLMKDVSEFVLHLERNLVKAYTAAEKKVILMHAAIMIERLILERGQEAAGKCKTIDPHCNEKKYQALKKAISVIEGKYNIVVNEKELVLLENLLF